MPGIAVQRLMADGYGFGAEGDWKTAALVRTMKVMAAGIPGGTSFMEDYTYHLDPIDRKVLGAHMLEICPSITADKPAVEIHPLSIGDRSDPVRLVFHAKPGPAPLFSAELAYPVVLPESADELAWEVSDYEPAPKGGRRLLRLTLQKESPHGVVIWWERALVGEAGCDTMAFPDRDTTKSASALKQADVWAEATRLFKEKVANRQKILVDVGDPDKEEEEEGGSGSGSRDAPKECIEFAPGGWAAMGAGAAGPQ